MVPLRQPSEMTVGTCVRIYWGISCSQQMLLLIPLYPCLSLFNDNNYHVVRACYILAGAEHYIHLSLILQPCILLLPFSKQRNRRDLCKFTQLLPKLAFKLDPNSLVLHYTVLPSVLSHPFLSVTCKEESQGRRSGSQSVILVASYSSVSIHSTLGTSQIGKNLLNIFYCNC